jgi:type VI secretion system protein ImpI
MALILTIENEESLPNGAPICVSLTDKRGIDIGRGTKTEWSLPDPSRFISSKHCEIRYRDDAYWLYDVSTNGTFLNESPRRIQAPHRLADGDRLAIGAYTILVAMEEEATEPRMPKLEAEVSEAEQGELISDEALNLAVLTAQPAVEPAYAALLQQDHEYFSEKLADFPRPILPIPVLEEIQIPHELPKSQPQFKQAQLETPAQVDNEPSKDIRSLNGAGRAPEECEAEIKAEALGSVPIARSQPDNETKNTDEFIRRFAKGAGVPEQIFSRNDGLQLAEDLGELMRLTVEGMTQLLGARFKAKRFARSSNQTTIQAFDNNPLKFAPTPQDALKIMFGPRTSGYLDAKRSFEAGFHDLKAHQIRTFSAMQHALRMLLEDLQPQAIDAATEADKGLAAFLYARKSRLWDIYVARWQAKALRHEDGLMDAFMLYFADCYDEASESMQSEKQ